MLAWEVFKMYVTLQGHGGCESQNKKKCDKGGLEIPKKASRTIRTLPCISFLLPVICNNCTVQTGGGMEKKTTKKTDKVPDDVTTVKPIRTTTEESVDPPEE